MTKAAELFELAIEREVNNVHLNVGMIYGIGGWGLRRNLEKAEYHLDQACRVDGDQDAIFLLEELRSRRGVFAGKEVGKPKLPWK